MARLWSLGKRFIRLKHIKISTQCKKQTAKWSRKRLLNMTIHLPSYMFRVHTLILLGSFFIHFIVELLPIVWIGRVNIVSLFCFSETDIREQKNYEKRIQTSVDNTVNDLHYEISLKIVWKTKITHLLSETLLFFLKQKYLLFL